MANDYAREKLFGAVDALVGSSSIQLRLTYAAGDLIKLRATNAVPAQLKERFESVMSTLTEKPLSNDRGYVPRLVTDEVGAKLAREIVSLYTDVMGGL
jgi:hypothetical protein